jgi:MraZ protein
VGGICYLARSEPGWRGSSRLFQPGSTYFTKYLPMAFRGSFDHTLDAKNRVTIPARLRKPLADGVVVALQRDANRCVAIWCAEDFGPFVDGQLQRVSPLSEDYGRMERFFNANSAELELDAAGRVMVPAHLLEKTKIGKEVVVIGAGNRLEVWDREAWKQEEGGLAAAVKEIGPGPAGVHTS